jgi:hypothetical protein
MTKNEQNRVVAWRLRIIRKPTNCLGASLRPAGISVALAKPSINGEPGTKATVTPACAIGPEHHFIFLTPHRGL